MEDKWIETIKQCKCLDEHDVKILCCKVKALLCEENNVQQITAPVAICGDIHGQFYDLMNIFQKGGELPEQKYVFLGDYVDRGYHSVETLEYLLCLKLKYQGRITLLRGNHESRQISVEYGFYEEIQRKYGNTNPWRYFNDLFDYLPIAAIIEKKIFCVHGGISPSLLTVDQMRLIDRKIEICTNRALADLMWSDPDEDIDTWLENSRGAGYLFGWMAVDKFNRTNGLELICRAHQLEMEGYKYWFGSYKSVVTVWSAPNYCYRSGNKASILKINENMEKEFKMFEQDEKSKNSTNYNKLIPYFL